MDVVGQSLDAVRKPGWVGDDHPIGVAGDLPTIIDVDELVTGRLHAVGGHGVGDATDGRVTHIAAKMVPAIPAHGRGQGQVGGQGAARKGETQEQGQEEADA